MFVILEGFFRVIAEFFPGKVHWNLDDIPDQSGKVVIITGANTGWCIRYCYSTTLCLTVS